MQECWQVTCLWLQILCHKSLPSANVFYFRWSSCHHILRWHKYYCTHDILELWLISDFIRHVNVLICWHCTAEIQCFCRNLQVFHALVDVDCFMNFAFIAENFRHLGIWLSSKLINNKIRLLISKKNVVIISLQLSLNLATVQIWVKQNKMIIT